MRARSTIIGFAVLTVLLTAGAAQSLSGTNTVFTDDIADGNVTTQDIRANAVTSSRIIDGGVFGTDIANNSVTGADVNEATLDGNRTFFARVRASGDLVDGDALDATKTAAGRYSVTFPFDVQPCAGTANTSDFPGFDNRLPNAVTHTIMALNNIAGVVITTTSGVETDGAFVLVLVCP